MFAVVPLRDCPHLDAVQEVPANGINVHDPCLECGSTAENWICLQCYTVHCARNVNEHAVTHGQIAEHPLTLSFSDLSVWCYGCEAYIDNPVNTQLNRRLHMKPLLFIEICLYLNNKLNEFNDQILAVVIYDFFPSLR